MKGGAAGSRGGGCNCLDKTSAIHSANTHWAATISPALGRRWRHTDSTDTLAGEFSISITYNEARGANKGHGENRAEVGGFNISAHLFLLPQLQGLGSEKLHFPDFLAAHILGIIAPLIKCTHNKRFER